MPPRYSYWTILAGGLPTSFRAADREDLLPTLRRLQERHPDAEMKWFQRGKIWDSPEAAVADLRNPSMARSRDWRPGGEHRDPREPFKKAKRERNQASRQRRFDHKHSNAAPQDSRQERSPAHAKPRFDAKNQARRPRQFDPKQSNAVPQDSRQERSPAHAKPRFDAKNQARRPRQFDPKQSNAVPQDSRQERSPAHAKPRFDAKNQARRPRQFDPKQSSAVPEDSRQEPGPARPKPRFDARRQRESARQAPKGGRRR